MPGANRGQPMSDGVAYVTFHGSHKKLWIARITRQIPVRMKCLCRKSDVKKLHSDVSASQATYKLDGGAYVSIGVS